MDQQTSSDAPQQDPAAVFACAISLWQACLDQERVTPELNLSDEYSGMDQLMREVMRVGEEFEKWSCLHVEFEACTGIWPYELEEHFGETCLKILPVSGLAQFNDHHCLRAALLMRLPMKFDDTLPLPIDIRVPNPIQNSAFSEFRLQTVRTCSETFQAVPFCLGDDPCDEELSEPYFGIYGFSENGMLEHIADRPTYSDAVSLLRKLAPGIYLPDKPKLVS